MSFSQAFSGTSLVKVGAILNSHKYRMAFSKKVSFQEREVRNYSLRYHSNPRNRGIKRFFSLIVVSWEKLFELTLLAQ